MHCANDDPVNAANPGLKILFSGWRKRLASGVLALFLGLVPWGVFPLGLAPFPQSGEMGSIALLGIALATDAPPPSSLRGNAANAPEQPVPVIDDEPEPVSKQSEQNRSGGQGGQNGLEEDGRIGIRANMSGSSITASPMVSPQGTSPGTSSETSTVMPSQRPPVQTAPDQATPAQNPLPDRPAPRTTKALPATTQPTRLRLFGTVEFKGPIKNLPQWLSVLQRNKENPIFDVKKKLGSIQWGELKGKLKGKSLKEQLQIVNRFWNQWPYRQDPEVYKMLDYWAIPAEFLKNSGDCEDYAIVKYFTLKEVGVADDQMRVVVLMETIRNIAHAVLVVYVDGDAFVLDNLSNNVISHSRYKNYAPQFSVNEEFRWAHLRPKK